MNNHYSHQLELQKSCLKTLNWNANAGSAIASDETITQQTRTEGYREGATHRFTLITPRHYGLSSNPTITSSIESNIFRRVRSWAWSSSKTTVDYTWSEHHTITVLWSLSWIARLSRTTSTFWRDVVLSNMIIYRLTHRTSQTRMDQLKSITCRMARDWINESTSERYSRDRWITASTTLGTISSANLNSVSSLATYAWIPCHATTSSFRTWIRDA